MSIHKVRLEILRAIFFISLTLWVLTAYSDVTTYDFLVGLGIIVVFMQLYEYRMIAKSKALR